MPVLGGNKRDNAELMIDDRQYRVRSRFCTRTKRREEKETNKIREILLARVEFARTRGN